MSTGTQRKRAARKVMGEMTERDERILQWLGRVRFATNEQISVRFDMHSKKSYARLALLVHLGFVRHARVLYNWPGVYSATAAGLRFANLPVLAPASVSAQQFVHDHTVVSEMVNREVGEAQVITEREMRHAQRISSDLYAIRLPPTQYAPASSHLPDLVVFVDGEWHAVEIELTTKTGARVAAILTGYLASQRYARVEYVVPVPRDIDRIRRIDRRVGLGNRLSIVCMSRPAL
jgi:hypothetical protein